METVYKTITGLVKGSDKETGIVDVLIPLSTSSVDRDGESIDPMAFKKRLKAFKSHPVLLSSHEYRDLKKQIGEWTSIKVTEEGLVGKPKYYINQGNEEADWGFFLASIGMAAYSVGFIPFGVTENETGDGDKTPRRTYNDVELLEVSHVVVPSNRDAAQSMRSAIAGKGVSAPADFLAALQDAEIVDTTGEPDEDEVPVVTDSKPEIYTIGPDKATHPKASTVSQDELKDELDYCRELVESVGVSDEVRGTAEALVVAIVSQRNTGGDTPVKIEGQSERPIAECSDAQVLVELSKLYRQYHSMGQS